MFGMNEHFVNAISFRGSRETACNLHGHKRRPCNPFRIIGYHLHGASMFVACGLVLTGYGESAHIDKGDPTFTAGFRVDQMPHENFHDSQQFFPESTMAGQDLTTDHRSGLILDQSAG